MVVKIIDLVFSLSISAEDQRSIASGRFRANTPTIIWLVTSSVAHTPYSVKLKYSGLV